MSPENGPALIAEMILVKSGGLHSSTTLQLMFTSKPYHRRPAHAQTNMPPSTLAKINC
jgi:hypothetical protein